MKKYVVVIDERYCSKFETTEDGQVDVQCSFCVEDAKQFNEDEVDTVITCLKLTSKNKDIHKELCDVVEMQATEMLNKSMTVCFTKGLGVIVCATQEDAELIEKCDEVLFTSTYKGLNAKLIALRESSPKYNTRVQQSLYMEKASSELSVKIAKDRLAEIFSIFRGE